jgi:tetratricopeptide (TPR) repeat protein
VIWHSDNPPEWAFGDLTYSYGYIANAYEDQGILDSALVYYRKAIRHLGQPPGARWRLIRFRSQEEYAHCLDKVGMFQQAVQEHRRAGSTLADLISLLDSGHGSSLAYSDAVAGLCHVATFVAPYEPALADSLLQFASDAALAKLGPEHELTRRVPHSRLNPAATRPPRTRYPRDEYVTAPWRLVKQNPMWGNNVWPPSH